MKKAQQLLQLMHRLHLVVPRCSKGFKDVDHLTVGQVQLIAEITSKGAMTMSEVADFLEITPASATSLVDRLEKHSWLVRVPNKEDRRKTVVELTDQGRQHLSRVMEAKLGMGKMLLSTLGEEEQDTFLELLDKIVVGIEKQY